MATENTPSRLNFNNVVSMGVSYSWEHGVDGNGPIDGCPDLSGQYIKRTKQVDLSVLNLDILM